MAVWQSQVVAAAEAVDYRIVVECGSRRIASRTSDCSYSAADCSLGFAGRIVDNRHIADKLLRTAGCYIRTVDTAVLVERIEPQVERIEHLAEMNLLLG